MGYASYIGGKSLPSGCLRLMHLCLTMAPPETSATDMQRQTLTRCPDNLCFHGRVWLVALSYRVAHKPPLLPIIGSFQRVDLHTINYIQIGGPQQPFSLHPGCNAELQPAVEDPSMAAPPGTQDSTHGSHVHDPEPWYSCKLPPTTYAESLES